MDEAGRGPLAGPVVAGACIIPQHVRIPGIDDSKKLTAAKREAIYSRLMEHPEVACATYAPCFCTCCPTFCLGRELFGAKIIAFDYSLQISTGAHDLWIADSISENEALRLDVV